MKKPAIIISAVILAVLFSVNAFAAVYPQAANAVMPETGGIGTTIFYTVGGILMVIAVILLVTKKRMNTK